MAWKRFGGPRLQEIDIADSDAINTGSASGDSGNVAAASGACGRCPQISHCFNLRYFRAVPDDVPEVSLTPWLF